MAFMLGSISNVVTADDITRFLLIAGVILGLPLSVNLLTKKRNRTSYLVLFSFWFSYLNLFTKFTYLFF